VTAVCALVDSSPVGLAASSFTSVSLEPPLVSVCIAITSETWPALRSAGRLGISVLSAEHDLICRQLSTKDGDRFRDLTWRSTTDGALFLNGVSAWLDCAIEREVDAGDHRIVLLRVHAADAYPDVPPLVFHNSRFSRLQAA
jgi:flavin reductase (DIM6/NTAB) family NADH-FMN oxidoreductase RutF